MSNLLAVRADGLVFAVSCKVTLLEAVAAKHGITTVFSGVSTMPRTQ